MRSCFSWVSKESGFLRVNTLLVKMLWCLLKWQQKCWRRLLRAPWTAWRSNQSVLREISPEYSLEELVLKLRLHTLVTRYGEPTHWKRPWCWERLRAGGDGGNRGWGIWMASPTRRTWVWANSRRRQGTGRPGALQPMEPQSRTWLSDWTTAETESS